MPESCADKILEEAGTESPDPLKSDSKTDKSLEFHAEIIPYDTCENSNSPIVACSGDDMHFIFSIPKKKFRKLAVAVIGRLGYDSDEESPEDPETSDNQSSRCELAKSGESSLASNFEVKDHEHRDTNMNGDSAKNEGDVCESDPKSYESSESLSKYKENICVRPIELNGELMSNGTKSFEIEASSKESSSDFRPDFANSTEVTNSSNQSLSANYLNSGVKESSNGIDSVMHENISRKCEETECDNSSGKSNIKESGESEPEQHAFSPEQNSDGDDTKSSGDHEEVNLSAYSLNISNEDCPELKTAWPDIHSYIKDEEIPVEELKSFESSGVFIKYYKLDFLKEIVVIKVSSSTHVFIDALKYKLSTDSKSLSCSEDSGTRNKEGFEETLSTQSAVSKFSSVTDVGNTKEDFTTNVSEIESTSELKEKDDCMQKKATEINAVPEENAVGTETSEDNNLQTEPDSRILSTPNKQPNCMDGTSEVKKSTLCDSEVEDILKKNASKVKCKFDVDKMEYKMLEKQFADLEVRKMLSIKIEQKLEESNVNIPGESPLERIRFSLTDSLKNISKLEATKQTEESVAGPSGSLSKEPNNEIKSLVKSNESDEIQIEEHLKVNSEGKYATEVSLEGCDSSEAIHLPGKNLSLDSKNLISDGAKENLQLNSENKTIGDFSSEDKSVENLKEDEDAVETSVPNFQDGISLSNINASLEEPSTEKSDSHLSTKDNFSREIELGSDDHEDSGIEVSNTCKQFENIKESKSHEQSTSFSTFLVKEIETNKCKSDNDICSSENVNIKDLSEQFIETCQEEARVKFAKFEGSKNTLEESEILNISDTNSSFEKSFSFEEKLNISKIVHDLEVSENAIEHMSEENGYTKEHEPGNSPVLKTAEVSHSSFLEENLENKEKKNAKFESEQIEELKAHNGEVKTESIFEKLAKDERTENVETGSVEFDETPLKCPENKSFMDKSSDSAENSVDDNVDDEKQLESSCISNVDHLMETTVEVDAESVSESGDMESDDLKSIASESDDSKDSEKSISVRKEKNKNRSKFDEVDCAPTRVRTKRIPLLSKDVIPENAEVKNVNSKSRSSNLNVTSKYSEKTSPVGRSLRSKSLDPSPEQSKISHDKKQGSIFESGVNRRKRATTPEVISKKDIKTTVRSSPRKLTRSATTEPSSASKVQSTKTSTADGGSKSRSNLDSSVLNSKRSKRGSKD